MKNKEINIKLPDEGSAMDYVLFNFKQVAISTAGLQLLFNTFFNNFEKLEIWHIVIFTICGVYTTMHGIRNAGSMSNYAKSQIKIV